MRFTPLSLLLIIFVSSCGYVLDAKCESMGFDGLLLQDITLIKAHDNRGDGLEKEPLIVIDDEEKISALIKFIVNRDKNWRAPWAGVPVGDLRIVFWSKNTRIRSFVVGQTFIESQGCGYFFIKNIFRTERDQIVELLGLDFQFE